jgi:Subtilisin-like serine proteases
MNKHIGYWIGLILCLLILILPGAAVQDGVPPIERGGGQDASTLRVIADQIGPDQIGSYVKQGCRVKHILKDAVSFDCPTDVVSGLDVRESRIFYITDLQAVQQTYVDKVWLRGSTGKGVEVAILDTGVDMNHPDLKDSYIAAGSYDCVHETAIPLDDNGHGTHVAGIITSNGAYSSSAKGVAPDAKFYMFKVCTAEGQCYEDDIYCGVQRAVQNTPARLISMSVGGGAWTTRDCDGDRLASWINWAVGEGVTAVVAAGNNPAGVSSPGCASKAIAVGAVDTTRGAILVWQGSGAGYRRTWSEYLLNP